MSWSQHDQQAISGPLGWENKFINRTAETHSLLHSGLLPSAQVCRQRGHPRKGCARASPLKGPSCSGKQPPLGLTLTLSSALFPSGVTARALLWHVLSCSYLGWVLEGAGGQMWKSVDLLPPYRAVWRQKPASVLILRIWDGMLAFGRLKSKPLGQEGRNIVLLQEGWLWRHMPKDVGKYGALYLVRMRDER